MVYGTICWITFFKELISIFLYMWLKDLEQAERRHEVKKSIVIQGDMKAL